MNISWYIILNIFSIIIIKGCKGIQEKEFKNLVDPYASYPNYISVNISSYDATNNFHIVSCEISGVDSILMFPKPKVHIGEILDGNTSLWKREEHQKFILGIISLNSRQTSLAMNLFIKTRNGIKNVLYRNRKGNYELITPLQYMDDIAKLKPIDSPEEYKMDIAKVNPPEIVDMNTKIDRKNVNLFIPHRKYRVTTVQFGANLIFDGSSDNYHVPIAIGYEMEGIAFLNIFIAEGDSDAGYIYKFRLDGLEFKFVGSSEKKAFYEIFTYHLEKPSHKPSLKSKDSVVSDASVVNIHTRAGIVDSSTKSTRADSIIDIEDIDIPRISLDITDVDPQFIKTEKHTVLNVSTIKYSPMGAIITKVTFGEKMIWQSSEEEIKCTEINIHLVNGEKHAVELLIQKKDGSIFKRNIPYEIIADSTYEDDLDARPTPSSEKKDLADEADANSSEESDIEEMIVENPDGTPVKESEKDEEQKETTGAVEDTEPEEPRAGTPPPSPTKPTNLNIKIPKAVGSSVFSTKETSVSTPPNSPARDVNPLEQIPLGTPPNSPARTPPPSPARSAKNSIYDEPLDEIDLENIKANMFRPIGVPLENILSSEEGDADGDLNKHLSSIFDNHIGPEVSDEKSDTDPEDVSTPDEVGSSSPKDHGSKFFVDRHHTKFTNEDDFAHNLDKFNEDFEDKETKDNDNEIEIENKNAGEALTPQAPIIPKRFEFSGDESESILDISSKESIEKMRIVDGTEFVPFIIMFAREEHPIRSVYDGNQCIWCNKTDNQIIRYVSLYLNNEQPTAMAILIIDRPGFKHKFYLKEMEEWFEVSAHDYNRATLYEFKKPVINTEEPESSKLEEIVDKDGNVLHPDEVDGEVKETTVSSEEISEKEKDKEHKELRETKPIKPIKKKTKGENVLHVSIMVPVILGTLFLLLWIGSILFIIFFI